MHSQRLFIKIFLWFWAVVFIAMLAAVVMLSWLKHDFVRPAHDAEVQHLIEMMDYQRPNFAEGRKLWRALQDGWNLVAVPVELTHELPPELEEFAELASQHQAVLYSQHDNWHLLGPLQRDDYLYLAVARPGWYSIFETHDRVLVLGAMLVVVSLLCFLLVWRLTAPILKLKQAVRHLAAGDFEMQQLYQLQQRKDEIGHLSNDIVEMVSALQRLLYSHQQLIHDVSHELRSPLTRLQIALGIARKKDTEQRLANEHNRIERAVGQVDQLISEILDLARLQENDPQRLQKTSGSLADQLQSWLLDADLELADKQLNLHWQLPQSPLLLTCDWLLLERAVDNIVRNAIRHSPKGATLSIGASEELQNATKVIKIWIQDQGEGVPEADLKDIFNAFVQVDSARDHAAGGYGLGLALVKRIVELHAGEISAKNCAPGLCITMTLPQE